MPNFETIIHISSNHHEAADAPDDNLRNILMEITLIAFQVSLKHNLVSEPLRHMWIWRR